MHPSVRELQPEAVKLGREAFNAGLKYGEGNPYDKAFQFWEWRAFVESWMDAYEEKLEETRNALKQGGHGDAGTSGEKEEEANE